MAQFLCGDGFLLPDLATETQVVRKNRSAGVSPASEPRQLLLGQHATFAGWKPAIHFFSRPQRLDFSVSYGSVAKRLGVDIFRILTIKKSKWSLSYNTMSVL